MAKSTKPKSVSESDYLKRHSLTVNSYVNRRSSTVHPSNRRNFANRSGLHSTYSPTSFTNPRIRKFAKKRHNSLFETGQKVSPEKKSKINQEKFPASSFSLSVLRTCSKSSDASGSNTVYFCPLAVSIFTKFSL